MLVLVLAATASGLDLDAVDGDAVVAKDMLGEAPDLSLCIHGGYMLEEWKGLTVGLGIHIKFT